MLTELLSIKTPNQLVEFSHTELRGFFQTEVEIDPTAASLVLNLRSRFQDLGFTDFDPIFLGGASFPAEAKYPGWRKQPNEWFYNQVSANRIPGSPLTLRRGWALVDTSIRPHYREGTQTFRNDQFSTIMANLRGTYRLGNSNPEVPANSRFAVSKEETELVIYPALTEIMLKPGEGRITSLKTIEFNYLGNLRYSHFGQGLNTHEFFEDNYNVGPNSESLTLRGGEKDAKEGGISSVDYCSTFNHLSHNTYRPVILLRN